MADGVPDSRTARGRSRGSAPSAARAASAGLLALLLLNANEVVPDDRLLEDLWGDEPPGERPRRAPRPRLAAPQGARRRRRAAPDPPARLRPPRRAGPDRRAPLRAPRSARAGSSSAQGSAELAAMTLREALGLWRGPALADVAYESFAQAEIARLEELRRPALEERIDADLALGRHAELVGELEALVAAEPLRERLRGQLMLALYRSGRQADALAAYRDARQILVDELGIEPGRALAELEAAILRQDPGARPARARAAEPAPAAARAGRGAQARHRDRGRPRGRDPARRIRRPRARRAPARALPRDDAGRDRRGRRTPGGRRGRRARRPSSAPRWRRRTMRSGPCMRRSPCASGSTKCSRGSSRCASASSPARSWSGGRRTEARRSPAGPDGGGPARAGRGARHLLVGERAASSGGSAFEFGAEPWISAPASSAAGR